MIGRRGSRGRDIISAQGRGLRPTPPARADTRRSPPERHRVPAGVSQPSTLKLGKPTGPNVCECPSGHATTHVRVTSCY